MRVDNVAAALGLYILNCRQASSFFIAERKTILMKSHV
jgi:hypothetical protein